MRQDRKMRKLDIRRFRDEEHGAATVDWVVLTGAIVFLGMAASFYVTSSVPQVANSISTYMENTEIGLN